MHKASDLNVPYLTGVSLFAGSGIGDLALQGCGVKVLVASELLPDRAEVYQVNFPEVKMIVGDIRDKDTKGGIIRAAAELLKGKPLDVLFVSPPCQYGLAIEIMDVVIALMPKVIVFEVAPEMPSTLNIQRFLATEYYVGCWETVEVADYGVAQRKKCLIGVFSRMQLLSRRIASGISPLPPCTYAESPASFQKPWVAIDEDPLNMTSSYPFKWQKADGSLVSDTFIREVVSESTPPKGLEVILAQVLRTLWGIRFTTSFK